ncbi:MAG: hypothetical protein JSR09_07600 [Bacteroidetes bacterium]|nr:hypothetical protein [Bacteroidota bacterium]MBS1639366.1 hypothetical protein [Bacteroidota bacterium]MBS1642892.1 hypothetical protein [Bacteroidota bacterium]MBS1649557.1 hypothetical protein [Bacteroidota bacterium]MBS1670379.1 hypothetical protein [Bacteroidota bacterium]
MKKIFFISLIIMLANTKNINAQTGVPDTLAYLQNIVANKAQYIGQPFSILKNSLQIQVKFFFPFASLPYDKTKETSTQFSFYFPQNADEMYLTYPSLRISWQQYLNANQSNIIRATNNNRGQWNVAAYNFITMQ